MKTTPPSSDTLATQQDSQTRAPYTIATVKGSNAFRFLMRQRSHVMNAELFGGFTGCGGGSQRQASHVMMCAMKGVYPGV
jgi:hypothetical protein